MACETEMFTARSSGCRLYFSVLRIEMPTVAKSFIRSLYRQIVPLTTPSRAKYLDFVLHSNSVSINLPHEL